MQYNIPIAKLLVLFVAISACGYIYLAFTKIFRGGIGKNGTTIAVSWFSVKKILEITLEIKTIKLPT